MKLDCLAPVALFVHRRPEHTRKTIEALLKNSIAFQTDLYVFADGARKNEDIPAVELVRELVRKIRGFRTVHITHWPANLGLAKSIISGVTAVMRQADRVIILEDDVVTDASFLAFMNRMLYFYRDDFAIGSISGYSPPIPIPANYPWCIYLTHRHSSWGWGTFRRVWESIDWNVTDYSTFRGDRAARRAFNVAGSDMARMLDRQMAGYIDSWSIRFDYSCFKQGLWSLASTSSLVQNIGFDGSGVHCGLPEKSRSFTLLHRGDERGFPAHLIPDARIIEATQKYFNRSWASRASQYIFRLFARR